MTIDGMKVIGKIIRHSGHYDAEDQFDYNGIPVGLGVCKANSLSTLKEFAEKFMLALACSIQPRTTKEVFFEWHPDINLIVINVLTTEDFTWAYVKFPQEAQISAVRFCQNPPDPTIGNIEGSVWTRDFSLQFLSPPMQPAEA